MNANNNQATNPTTERNMTRPVLGGQEQRIYYMDIEFEEELEEGVAITGEITNCYIFTSGNLSKFLKLEIRYGEEHDKRVFESIHKCPLPKWSPLKPLLVELQSDNDGKAQPNDLIGLLVEFTVKYNAGKNGVEYCNLNTIDFVYDEPAADDTPDDADSESGTSAISDDADSGPDTGTISDDADSVSDDDTHVDDAGEDSDLPDGFFDDEDDLDDFDDDEEFVPPPGYIKPKGQPVIRRPFR